MVNNVEWICNRIPSLMNRVEYRENSYVATQQKVKPYVVTQSM